jgi:hypothetical protein
MYILPGHPYIANGAMTNAVISGATTLTFADGSNICLLQATGANVYYTIDGSTPSAINGFTMYDGADPVYIEVVPTQVVKVIQASGSPRLRKQDMKKYYGTV